MRYETILTAAIVASLAVAFSFAEPVQAGTCQPVRAKGVAKDMKTATLYAQADLKQTAKSMKGKATQATTKCDRAFGEFHFKVDAWLPEITAPYAEQVSPKFKEIDMAVGASAAAAILNWPARQASEDIGAPGTARTCNPQIRSLVLYPMSYGRLQMQ